MHWTQCAKTFTLKDASEAAFRSLYTDALISADHRFLGPYAKLCRQRGGGGGEIIDETHLSVFHSVSNHTRGKR